MGVGITVPRVPAHEPGRILHQGACSRSGERIYMAGVRRCGMFCAYLWQIMGKSAHCRRKTPCITLQDPGSLATGAPKTTSAGWGSIAAAPLGLVVGSGAPAVRSARC